MGSVTRILNAIVMTNQTSFEKLIRGRAGTGAPAAALFACSALPMTRRGRVLGWRKMSDEAHSRLIECESDLLGNQEHKEGEGERDDHVDCEAAGVSFLFLVARQVKGDERHPIHGNPRLGFRTNHSPMGEPREGPM